MIRRDVVVVAASAGGIDALRQLVAGLPPDYPGSVLVVLHMPTTGSSALSSILDRSGPLAAAAAESGESVRAGRVYVCVPDHHLLVREEQVLLRRGPRENGHRPAADPLFRSAARYFGPRVVGVVLSGNLSDGSAGLAAVVRAGGVAVVQDPGDAMYRGMPSSAIDQVGADHVLPVRAIGPLLADLAARPVERETRPVEAALATEVYLMEEDDSVLEGRRHAKPSPWPCPDCSGVLWEVDDDILRFRCRVGHAWSADNLHHEQGVDIEAALWVALRSLEDRAALSSVMAERAETSGRTLTASRFRSDLADLTASIEVLRRLVAAEGPAWVLDHEPGAESTQERDDGGR